MIPVHYRRRFSVSAVCFMIAACSPAQVKKIETGIPDDAALVGCVITEALGTDMNVAAIALACGAKAEQVAELLYQASTLPKGATNTTVRSATNIRSTKAFADAYANYPRLE